jgi:hypothetical protein
MRRELRQALEAVLSATSKSSRRVRRGDFRESVPVSVDEYGIATVLSAMRCC